MNLGALYREAAWQKAHAENGYGGTAEFFSVLCGYSNVHPRKQLLFL